MKARIWTAAFCLFGMASEAQEISSSGEDRRANEGASIQAEEKQEKASQLFFQQVAAQAQTQVELGELAQKKSRHPGVQTFARMMVQEHSLAKTQAEIAAGSAPPAPGALKTGFGSIPNQLENADGSDFDKAYMETMLRSHQQTARQLARAAKQSDSEVKNFAEQMKPKVDAHLDQARTIAASLGLALPAIGSPAGAETGADEEPDEPSDKQPGEAPKESSEAK